MCKVNTEKEHLFLQAIKAGDIQVFPTGWVLHHGRPIGTHGNGRGYVLGRVNFSGKRMSIMLHRLIWLGLVGGIPADREINHIDGDKQNNALHNLELCTRGENIKHAWDNSLRHYVLPRVPSTYRKPPKIDRAGIIAGWELYQVMPIALAAEVLGIHSTCLFRRIKAEGLPQKGRRMVL